MKHSILPVLEDIKNGIPVIIVDSMDRENEGDLMIAGQCANIKNIAFMCRHGRGIMCLPATGELLDKLDIPLMVANSTDPFNTAFTVSIDAAENITTGVSASDRVETIKVMVNPTSIPTDLNRPGHLFPLRARERLLIDRRGHTESSVTLTNMLGFTPLAVISEIMNDDGTMARLPELRILGATHGLKILSIEELCAALEI